MGQKFSSGYCPYCKERVSTHRRSPNHLLHLILSFFTGGIWLIVWILLAISAVGGYRCQRCGSKV